MNPEILRGADQFDTRNYQQDNPDMRDDLERMIDTAILQADYLRQVA